jgi:hypothetical protein
MKPQRCDTYLGNAKSQGSKRFKASRAKISEFKSKRSEGFKSDIFSLHALIGTNMPVEMNGFLCDFLYNYFVVILLFM